jgi:hypothetical protein
MVLITANMVSIDLQIHYATRASSASGLPRLPKSMNKSEPSQAEEGYFVLTLSLHTCLQQLPHGMA